MPILDSSLNYEIVGDEIRQLEQAPLPPPRDDYDDDAESVNEALATLPEMQVDPNKHFVKKSKYVSEIQNLLKCQGGSCPGVPKSAHIIQLLGKSPSGELVFEKFTSSQPCIPNRCIRLGFCRLSTGYAVFTLLQLFIVISASTTWSLLLAPPACLSAILKVGGGTD